MVSQIIRTVVRKEQTEPVKLSLTKPETSTGKAVTKTVYTIAEQQAAYSVLQQVGDTITIDALPDTTDLYTAACQLAATYRLDTWLVYDELRRLYESDDIPNEHLPELARQIEEQTRHYEVKEEKVDVALALVKMDPLTGKPDEQGWKRELESDGTEVYTAEIRYPKSKQSLLASWEEWKERAGGFGFHYSPYNFDSHPEESFFEQLLTHVGLHPDEIEDIYFTGALTDPNKTEFFVDYRDDQGKWRHYTPDFVIRRKDGRCMIIEIKNAQFKAATDEDLKRAERGEAAITVEGRKAIAVKQWQDLNPSNLRYEIIFADEEALRYDKTKAARQFVEEKTP